jgi:hypothetical protein
MKTMMMAMLVLAQAVATAGQQSTGHPACDQFMQMVTECIATKMPPAAGAHRRQELDAFRLALDIIPEGQAAQSCTENIRLEIQRDRYGCYAAAGRKAGIQTPCSLVSRVDLEQWLGSSYTEGQPGGSKCTYARSDGSPRTVTLDVRWTGGREELAAARAAAPASTATRATLENAVVSGRTIRGLGDDAFLLHAGFMPMLHARKGDAAVIVNAPLDEAQLVAIARQALDRMAR